jgi:dephospho-CoA kinase
VGLTGNIGGGKSSVARLLAEHGAFIIDADDLARQATSDPAVLNRISAELGAELVKDGELDRQAVAAAVFADPAARSVLNSIIHPWVGLRRLQLQAEALERAEPPPVVVHDVPLLFEVGLDKSVDVTLVVVAPLAVRTARVMQRSGLTEEQVRQRDAAQMPQKEKEARADFVIDNSAGEAELKEAVARLWPELLAHRATDA